MTQPHTLPDLLFSHPRLVFIGTAAGRVSAARGAYYANPSNKFWRTLHEVGLTPHRFAPEQFRELRALGIGLTDLNKTDAGMDHQINTFDVEGLSTRLANAAPAAIAFTSKKGASLYLQRPTRALPYGRLVGPHRPALFILPSPSGAAGPHWRIGPWQDVSEWFQSRA